MDGLVSEHIEISVASYLVRMFFFYSGIVNPFLFAQVFSKVCLVLMLEVFVYHFVFLSVNVVPMRGVGSLLGGEGFLMFKLHVKLYLALMFYTNYNSNTSSPLTTLL